MYTLGVETSCDDTSLAVLRGSARVLSNVVSSSIRFHKKYGGVIPEIASRMHLEIIDLTLKEALKQAQVKLKDIGLVAVTAAPGLKGSLLVGICFARALAFGLNKPLIEVNHLDAHLYAAFLQSQRAKRKFPFVGLVVSGGHTSLFYVKDFASIENLGFTLDDAAGEAFDKVAKILGLGYPGGPLIERLALNANPGKIKFSRVRTKRPLDFSFSGIKTAVLYAVKGKRLRLNEKKDIAASFQEAAIDSLLEKSFSACRIKRSKLLVVGGGVAANRRLRERFASAAKKEKIEISFSPLQFSTDNAAMVAGLGYVLFKSQKGVSCRIKR